jgi:hypothetical protein
VNPRGEPVPDDRQLLRYLFGQLSEVEQERLDEASIVDERVAWRLRVLEDDLVDAYACDTLDLETRHVVARTYLTSPARREKVAFARRFLAALERLSSRCVDATASQPRARSPVRTGPAANARASQTWRAGSLFAVPAVVVPDLSAIRCILAHAVLGAGCAGTLAGSFRRDVMVRGSAAVRPRTMNERTTRWRGFDHWR